MSPYDARILRNGQRIMSYPILHFLRTKSVSLPCLWRILAVFMLYLGIIELSPDNMLTSHRFVCLICLYPCLASVTGSSHSRHGEVATMVPELPIEEIADGPSIVFKIGIVLKIVHIHKLNRIANSRIFYYPNKNKNN